MGIHITVVLTHRAAVPSCAQVASSLPEFDPAECVLLTELRQLSLCQAFGNLDSNISRQLRKTTGFAARWNCIGVVAPEELDQAERRILFSRLHFRGSVCEVLV